MKRPTIADIAQRPASPRARSPTRSTASPACPRRPAQRILAIADEMGFPNSAARALSGAGAQAVGLALCRPARILGVEPFFMELISGMEAELSARSYALMLQVVANPAEESTSTSAGGGSGGWTASWCATCGTRTLAFPRSRASPARRGHQRAWARAAWPASGPTTPPPSPRPSTTSRPRAPPDRPGRRPARAPAHPDPHRGVRGVPAARPRRRSPCRPTTPARRAPGNPPAASSPGRPTAIIYDNDMMADRRTGRGPGDGPLGAG